MATESEEASATPGLPTAPKGLTATAGNGEVTLSWTAPAYAGTPTLTRYEYRYTSVSDRRGAGMA